MRLPVLIPLSLIAALLAACGSPGPRPPASTETIAQASRPVSEKGNEIVLYAMGLLDTGYRFGGKNPEAGLDCSGMV
jgi:cell wall-associated NlpC family hydrolase